MSEINHAESLEKALGDFDWNYKKSMDTRIWKKSREQIDILKKYVQKFSLGNQLANYLKDKGVKLD